MFSNKTSGLATTVGFDAPAGTADLHVDLPYQVHYRGRAADLASAGHDIDVVARSETVIHIDAAHRGLGTASCGPDTLAAYLVGPGTYEWTWTLRGDRPA